MRIEKLKSLLESIQWKRSWVITSRIDKKKQLFIKTVVGGYF
jgi:hypothetical protein